MMTHDEAVEFIATYALDAVEENEREAIEAHLLDFDEDLYDEVVTVWLVSRLRAQRAFASVDALVAQLHDDVEATRTWSETGWRPEDVDVRLLPGRGFVLSGGLFPR